MSLGKIQSSIVANLVQGGRLTSDDQAALVARPDELTGEALDRVLQEDHKVGPWHLLMAKAKAHGLPPCQVGRCRTHAGTFALLSEDFCREHQVLPVGQLGDLLLVAVADPFNEVLVEKMQRLSGRTVVRLLAGEAELREAFPKKEQMASDFTDVVEAYGREFDGGGT